MPYIRELLLFPAAFDAFHDFFPRRWSPVDRLPGDTSSMSPSIASISRVRSSCRVRGVYWTPPAAKLGFEACFDGHPPPRWPRSWPGPLPPDTFIGRTERWLNDPLPSSHPDPSRSRGGPRRGLGADDPAPSCHWPRPPPPPPRPPPPFPRPPPLPRGLRRGAASKLVSPFFIRRVVGAWDPLGFGASDTEAEVGDKPDADTVCPFTPVDEAHRCIQHAARPRVAPGSIMRVLVFVVIRISAHATRPPAIFPSKSCNRAPRMRCKDTVARLRSRGVAVGGEPANFSGETPFKNSQRRVKDGRGCF